MSKTSTTFLTPRNRLILVGYTIKRVYSLSAGFPGLYEQPLREEMLPVMRAHDTNYIGLLIWGINIPVFELQLLAYFSRLLNVCLCVAYCLRTCRVLLTCVLTRLITLKRTVLLFGL